MKQIEVKIMSQSYLLGCPEGGETKMLAAVEKVDAAMCKIRDAAKIKARERIAVLAALNLAFAQAETHVASTSHEELVDISQSDNHSLNLLINKLDAALADDDRLL